MASKSDRMQRHLRKAKQRGLSLLELLISLVVLALLMAGLSELVATNSRNAVATGSLSQIEETGRTAMQLLSADIRRAGYLGGNASIEMLGGTLELPGNSVSCAANSTDWALMMGQPVVGINDAKPSGAGYSCVADSEFLRGDVLTLRYVQAWPTADGDMVAKRPYLRTTLVEGRVFEGEDAADPNNVIMDNTARAHAVVAHTYFVGPSGRSCSGEPIPSLFRKSISDTALPVSSELLAGVEHLQFRYQVGNRYLDADDVGNWDQVEAVEATVLVRAECPEGNFTNNRTFPMGDLASAYGPADEFRRQVYTTLTRIRN